ncbi:MAG: S8 family serine peptidase [Proteobacteria bacterium]|nr:S8 family serine peptidase [Pseudomonadota bacterium]
MKKPSLYILTSTFILASCGGGGGGSSAPGPSPSPSASVTISASSTAVFEGDEFTISWSSSNASSCSASGAWSGDKSTSGNEIVTIASSGTYSFSITCSGSNTSDTKSISVNVEVKTFKISGTINSLAFSDLDGDVPNPSLPVVANNLEPLGVQEILNPTQLIGHLSYDSSLSSNDDWDLYTLKLVGGQYASLEIADWDENDPSLNDLDLYILDSSGEIFRTSTGSDWYETVTLPSEGTFYIAVNAYAGKSKYVLTIGSIYQGFQLSNYSSEVGIESDQILIAPKKDNDFNELFKNERFNGLDIDKNSFFNFKNNQSLSRDSNIFEINNSDSELRRAQNSLKSRLRDSFVIATEKQIEDIVFRKYVSLLNSSFKNFYIEPVFKNMSHTFVPADLFNYQWDLLAINTPEAVNAVGSQTNNTVAVLDTGSPSINSYAYTNTDYVDGGYDFIDNDSDPTGPVSDNHGAHVAGTIAAKGVINGMNAKVLPIKVLGSNGGSEGESILNGLKYSGGEENSSGISYSSSQFPIAAVNMSLGGCYTSEYQCNEISNFIARTNIPVVVASGNCRCNGVFSENYCPVATSPAQCEGVVRVAATDFENKRSYYSSYDQTVDIAAPGGDTSVDKNADGYPDGILSYSGDGDLDFWQGTSMAAPHVAGAIALMKAVNPQLTPTDIDNMIIEGKMTDDIDAVGKDEYTGYGLLNVAKAVDEASRFEAGSPIKDSVIVSPTQLSYAFTNDALDVTIKKIGDGDLSITGIYADQVDGVFYSAPGENLPFGTYTFSIDREFYDTGSYQNTFYFGLSDGTFSRIQASFAVGDPRELPNLGSVYVLLYDHDADTVIDSKEIDISSGSANYEFANLESTKNYRISVGSDIDNDNFIGQWGEVFDSIPSYNDPERESFQVDQDLSGVNLSLTPISAISFNALEAADISFNEISKLD